MSIPEFNTRGTLPKGLYNSTPEEFIKRFCYGEIKSESIRSSYSFIINELVNLSYSKGAESIIFGGSFITNTEEPHDLDCIIIVPNEKCIPARDEHMIVTDCKLDIIYIVKDNEKLIYSMMNLFSRDKYELEVGLIELSINSEVTASWNDYDSFMNFEELITARGAYEYRHILTSSRPKGVIVSIHGFNTHAQWNCELAPIVSSNNWIFAPYNYGNVKSPLVNRNETKKIMNHFRDWIKNLRNKYGFEPNIIAHSFGTYILGKYIEEFNYNPPVKFEDVVLTGSILRTDFDWIKAFENNTIKSLYNIASSNDQWVGKIGIPKYIKGEDLYGTAGVNGFKQEDVRIIQETIDIFDHSNMLMTDVFEHRIIPFFDLNSRIKKYDDLKYIDFKKISKESIEYNFDDIF